MYTHMYTLMYTYMCDMRCWRRRRRLTERGGGDGGEGEGYNIPYSQNPLPGRQRAEKAEAREAEALERIGELEALQCKWLLERAALIGSSVELEKQVSFISAVGLFWSCV
jgi:hypothetical protein